MPTLYLIYFSASGTTQKILHATAQAFMEQIALGKAPDGADLHMNNAECQSSLDDKDKFKMLEYNLCSPGVLEDSSPEMFFSENAVVLFGMPAYMGRIPALAAHKLQKLKGQNTPAAVIVTYGNRAYDDAILELRDVVKTRGFIPLAGASFIAKHSLIPTIAANRPDAQDLNSAQEFGKEFFIWQNRRNLVSAGEAPQADLPVKGIFPYREAGAVPMYPKANSRCIECGLCAKECPVGAIDIKELKKTNKSKCIQCAHCVHICPTKARGYNRLIYWIASHKLTKVCGTEYKKPEFWYC